MNEHIQQSQSTAVSADRAFVLAALRCTSRRLKLIDDEVTMIGTALKRGLISPQTAIDWAEEVAPGCIDVVVESQGPWVEIPDGISIPEFAA